MVWKLIPFFHHSWQHAHAESSNSLGEEADVTVFFFFFLLFFFSLYNPDRFTLSDPGLHLADAKRCQFWTASAAKFGLVSETPNIAVPANAHQMRRERTAPA